MHAPTGIAFLLFAVPLAAQGNERFHFQDAPRWYDFSTFPGRPMPSEMTAVDYDSDGDLDLVRLLYNRVEYGRNDGGSLVAGGTYDPTLGAGFLGVDVARGNFDADGIPDLVLVGKNQMFPYRGTMQVLSGDGAGGFTPQPPDLLTWDDPLGLGVVVGDVNADGLSDVVVWESFQDQYEVDTTGGGFQLLSADIDNHLVECALGDLRGDGFPEIVVLAHSPAGGELEIRTNDGTGAYLLPPKIVVVPALQPFGLELGDPDADGDLDALTTDPDWALGTTDLLVFPNDGLGNFGAPTRSNLLGSTWACMDIELAYLDPDGDLDAVLSFGAPPDVVTTARGDGAGGFQTVASASIPAAELVVADLSGTGTMELLTAGAHVVPVADDGSIGGPGIAPGSGPLSFGLQATLDFDRDGRGDVATYESGGGVIRCYRGDGEGGFLPPLVFPLNPPTAPLRVEAADIDGDGWEDIVLPTATAIVTLLNQGGVTASAPITTDLSALGCSTQLFGHDVGDVDGDGRADVIRGAKHNADMILALGTASGAFTAACVPKSELSGEMLVAEVTGDALPDVVYVSRDDGGITVLPGTGGPTFGAPLHKSFAVDLLEGLAAGDVDLDGDADLVVGSTAGLAVLTNPGTGSFVLGQVFANHTSWRDVHVVDMDDDGWPEVVARHKHADASFWVFPSNAGTFATPTRAWDFSTGGSGFDGTSVDVADLDGDRYPDVLAGGYLPEPGILRPKVYLNRTALRGDGVPTGGNTIELALRHPLAGGQPHVMLASFTGTWPGVPLFGAVLPLNYDPLLWPASLSAAGTFVGFVGTFDAAGESQAQLVLPAGFSLTPALPIDLAFATLDALGNVRTSNSWGTKIR